jgi:hypothetical protein
MPSKDVRTITNDQASADHARVALNVFWTLEFKEGMPGT